MLFPEACACLGFLVDHLHLVPERGNEIIAVDDLDGVIALVQGGVLEIHTRGATIDDRERADRLVFDLDPGPGTSWDDVVEAARHVRARLSKLKLKSFLKTSGGKGLHVVLPIKATPWERGERSFHTENCSLNGGRIARALHCDRHEKWPFKTNIH